MNIHQKFIINDLVRVTISRIIVDIAILLAIFCFLPSYVQAETIVTGEDIKENWVWEKSGSPYILAEDIYMPEGNLYIKEGVKIRSNKDPYTEEPYSLSGEANIFIEGTKDEPIEIKDLYSISVKNADTNIKHAVFDGVQLELSNSTSTVDSTTFRNSFEAITAQRSRINITNSIFDNNSYGIQSKKFNPIFQVRSNSEIYGIGGSGEIDEGSFDYEQNIIKISNSSIDGIKINGIKNQTTNPVDARNNWWGSPSGPGGSNSGLVIDEPWLTVEPGKTEECCSSVVFIPGIMSSRLYKDEQGLNATRTITLWEPGSDQDVRDLYMDENGQSIDSSIYTKDVIDSAFKLPIYGGYKIYQTFIETMDSLVDSGEINDWHPFAYDWRKSVNEVVDQEFVDKVIEIAEESKTKKVTIISHSNGGLVAKKLVKELESRGKDEIVENLIFVAVPELGTPKAILSLLHGYGQSLVLGMLPTAQVAREFAKNLASAYSLLPTKEFFEKNPIPVISDLFSKDNKIVSSFSSMVDFLLSNSFSKVSPLDLNTPLLLNSKLLAQAVDFHGIFDKWKPKEGINSLSVVGLGLPTPAGIVYKAKELCLPMIFVCKPEYNASTTRYGDETVMAVSSRGNSDKTIYLDLKKIQDEEGKKIKHVNIFESTALLAKLEDIITNKVGINEMGANVTETNQTAAVANYEKYFSTTLPVYDELDLTIRVHSPVNIDIYDKQGRHTGPMPSSDPRSQYMTYEDNIPGSYYADFNGSKMIVVPYDDYRINLTGTDVGVFTVDLEVTKNDKRVTSANFGIMPVTPITFIDMIVATSTENFATSTMMHIDLDGDMNVDIVNRTDEFYNSSDEYIGNLPTYLEATRKTIISMKLPMATEKLWLNRIDRISRMAENKNYKNVEKAIRGLTHGRLMRVLNRKMTDKQKTEMLQILSGVLTYIETKN